MDIRSRLRSRTLPLRFHRYAKLPAASALPPRMMLFFRQRRAFRRLPSRKAISHTARRLRLLLKRRGRLAPFMKRGFRMFFR